MFRDRERDHVMSEESSGASLGLSEDTLLHHHTAESVKPSSASDNAQAFAHDIGIIFDRFMEHTPIYVFVKDERTRAIRLSRNYERLLGKPLDQLLNKTVEELFPSGIAESMIADDMRVLNGTTHEKIEEAFNGRTYATIKFPVAVESRSKYIAGFTIDITEQKKAEAERHEVIQQLRKTLGAVIETISAMVETRDPYTAGHQRRVADLARSIAREMGLQRDQIEGIRMAGSIHDIGKISIPAEILSKPTQLTSYEYALIKAHPQTAADILRNIEFTCPISRIVLEHHERMDGSGYPKGLKGDDIILEARILMTADVVEAMSSDRPYRPGLGIDAALDNIVKNKGKGYDPDVVDVCVMLFRNKGYQFRAS